VNRPFLLRLLPDRAAISVQGRFYRGKHASWTDLYSKASLRYAPGVVMDVVPGDVVSDRIAFTGVYEPQLTRRVVELAKKGGLFVDIGANLGYFALLWATAHPSNRCLAFEASPRNVDLLRRNIKQNGLESQIEVIPHAAGAEKGKLRFDLGPEDQTGWGGLLPVGTSEGIEVDVLRVDEIITGEQVVSLMKVDTEGADAWALMGCDRLFKERSVSEVWFEQHKPRIRALGLSENAAQDYLRSVGYSVKPLSKQDVDLVEWIAVPGSR
jgi:FkbM family methyltransferase